MGCGCGADMTNNSPNTSYKKQKDVLSGKLILDHNNNQLLITAPIYDTYGDIVGYIAKDMSGNTVRIFAKNVVKILE